MADQVTQMVVVPVDGSSYSLKTLNYLSMVFGPNHPIRIHLLHLLPSLPPIMVEEASKNQETARQLHRMESKQKSTCDKILEEAKWVLNKAGFGDEHIRTVPLKKKIGVARDICSFSEDQLADAIAIGTRGRTKLEAFIVGETANKVLEVSRICPVWLVKGDVEEKGVLIAIDNSENALRAVDHAGLMLAQSDCPITVFYAKRKLRRFIPKEILEDAPELEKLWLTTEGKAIAPFMENAEAMLLKAGVAKNRLTLKIIDGSRNTADDILKETAVSNCGTIVMGRRGLTGFKAYTMGSVSRKIIEGYQNTALWLVP